MEVGHYDLPPPEVRPNGTMIVYMALAHPGVRAYDDGLVYTPPEVLASEAFTSQIAGTVLIDDDKRTHVEGVSLDEPSRLGMLLDARWDEAQQVVIARAAIDTALGLQRVRVDRKIGVSVAYDNDEIEEDGAAPDGTRYTHRETARFWPDNVALTYTPRAERAHLQADSSGATMEDETTETPTISDAMKTLITDAVKAAVADAIEAMKPKEEEKPEADAEAEAEEPEADDYTMADAQAVVAAADSLGVTIDPKDSIKTARLKLAQHYAPGRADSMTDREASLVLEAATKARADSRPDPWSWQSTPNVAQETDAHGIPTQAFRR